MRYAIPGTLVLFLAGAGAAAADPGGCPVGPGCCVSTHCKPNVTLWQQPAPGSRPGPNTPVPGVSLYPKEILPPRWTCGAQPPPVKLYELTPPPPIVYRLIPPPVKLFRFEQPPPVWTCGAQPPPVTLYRGEPQQPRFTRAILADDADHYAIRSGGIEIEEWRRDHTAKRKGHKS